MIDERADRDSLGQLDQVPDVIDVVMGRDQIVDLLHAGIRDRRQDAIEIPLPGEAGVDDGRLAGRSHVESGFAPFDINHPDFERPRRPALSRDEYAGEADQQCYRDASHTNLQSFCPAHHYYWRRRCLVYFLS
jgi:hypothetical protein